MNKVEDLIGVTEESFKLAISPPRGVGLPWWPKLNHALGGLRPNELTLITAPTGSGKTALLSNISVQLLASGVSQFVASVETGRHDYFLRMASAMDAFDFNSGDPVPVSKCEEFARKHRLDLKKNNAWFAKYDDRVLVEDMVQLLQEQVEQHKIKVALLDNLNFFLKVTSSHMEKQEMDTAIHTFVMLVKKLPIHVILVVHPKKTQDGRVTSEFDIKGSSTAVQEASNVLLFNRVEKEKIESGLFTATHRELMIAKLRRRGKFVGSKFYFMFSEGRYLETSV